MDALTINPWYLLGGGLGVVLWTVGAFWLVTGTLDFSRFDKKYLKSAVGAFVVAALGGSVAFPMADPDATIPALIWAGLTTSILWQVSQRRVESRAERNDSKEMFLK